MWGQTRLDDEDAQRRRRMLYGASHMGTIILVIVVILLLLGVGIGFFFYMKHKKHLGQSGDASAAAQQTAASSVSSKGGS